jgi:hypothetical protein
MEEKEACDRREQQWHCVPDLHTTSHPRYPQEKDPKEARGEQRVARRFLLPRRSSAYMLYLIRIKPQRIFCYLEVAAFLRTFEFSWGATKRRSLI